VKVFFDHNMSPAMGRAIRELFRDHHEIALLREKFHTGVTDLEWIAELSRDGRWVIISEDRRITRNRAEYAAFRNSRLVGFFLSQGLHKAPVIKKMERLLALWSTIETLSSTVEGGAMFELPTTSTRVRQLRL
jgi:hypothetical protein